MGLGLGLEALGQAEDSEEGTQSEKPRKPGSSPQAPRKFLESYQELSKPLPETTSAPPSSCFASLASAISFASSASLAKKIKEGKETKEAKEGKQSKEAKEAIEGKEAEEAKVAREAKESPLKAILGPVPGPWSLQSKAKLP